MIKNIEQPTAFTFLNKHDIIVFSHLRWGFVYQRPQHLLSRFAKHTRVFFFEEPIFHDLDHKLHIAKGADNVYTVIPYIKHGTHGNEVLEQQRTFLNNLISLMNLDQYVSWYYTPMALPFTDHLKPTSVVYDCMDELSNFKFAPPELKSLEQKLFEKASVVFTGGYSIYEAKKNRHRNIHAFPSSIDKHHFEQARKIKKDPADQADIKGPRFGFYGVVDERFDIEMIRDAATARPEWQFIIIGPVVKIDPETLPKNENIHYLGGKSYQELPEYLAGWDIAIIPFAINDSTKFISPTKTPEYLAAGKPVISTPIRDVVSPYGDIELVHIASNAEEFVQCADKELAKQDREKWLTQVDNFLSTNSWDKTWSMMAGLIEQCLRSNTDTTVKYVYEDFAKKEAI